MPREAGLVRIQPGRGVILFYFIYIYVYFLTGGMGVYGGRK